MADEVDQKESLPGLLPGDQSPSGENDLEQDPVFQAGTVELESLVAVKNEELAKANDRITELEQIVASQDDQIAVLEQTEAEFEARLSTVNNSLTQAVTTYKDMVIQANPEILEELISGDSIESVNESLNQAKALTNRVREGVEAQISLTRIPSGAPERIALDLSALSPREKIQYSIGKVT